MISPNLVYSISPGSSVVKGPYVAETIAVSVESDYVVVDL
jgi:3-phenylpropionate/trans-cinnamate dioxygenase ferredoxin subunit